MADDTVFLSATNPGSGAEEVWSDPVFLIKGKSENGLAVYYRTRALEKYIVPVAPPLAPLKSATEYFNAQSAGQVYLAVQLDTTETAVEVALAHTNKPPAQN